MIFKKIMKSVKKEAAAAQVASTSAGNAKEAVASTSAEGQAVASTSAENSPSKRTCHGIVALYKRKKGKYDKLIVYLKRDVEEREEEQRQEINPKLLRDPLLFLIEKMFSSDHSNNPWSLAWATDDFRISNLDENKNYFIFADSNVEYKENVDCLTFHQCLTRSKKCNCLVAKHIWQPKHPANQKIFGHFSTLVNQRQIFFNVLEHIVKYQGLQFVCGKISNITLKEELLNSDHSKLCLNLMFSKYKQHKMIKLPEMRYICMRGVRTALDGLRNSNVLHRPSRTPSLLSYKIKGRPDFFLPDIYLMYVNNIYYFQHEASYKRIMWWFQYQFPQGE